MPLSRKIDALGVPEMRRKGVEIESARGGRKKSRERAQHRARKVISWGGEVRPPQPRGLCEKRPPL